MAGAWREGREDTGGQRGSATSATRRWPASCWGWEMRADMAATGAIATNNGGGVPPDSGQSSHGTARVTGSFVLCPRTSAQARDLLPSRRLSCEVLLCWSLQGLTDGIADCPTGSARSESRPTAQHSFGPGVRTYRATARWAQRAGKTQATVASAANLRGSSGPYSLGWCRP